MLLLCHQYILKSLNRCWCFLNLALPRYRPVMGKSLNHQNMLNTLFYFSPEFFEILHISMFKKSNIFLPTFNTGVQYILYLLLVFPEWYLLASTSCIGAFSDGCVVGDADPFFFFFAIYCDSMHIFLLRSLYFRNLKINAHTHPLGIKLPFYSLLMNKVLLKSEGKEQFASWIITLSVILCVNVVLPAQRKQNHFLWCVWVVWSSSDSVLRCAGPVSRSASSAR